MPDKRYTQALLIVSTLREVDAPPEWAVEYTMKCLLEAETRGAKRELCAAADELAHDGGKLLRKARNVLLGFDNILIAAWLKRRAAELE